MSTQLENALLIGGLAAAGVYLVLQWSFLRVLLGFIILSNTALLFVLSAGGEPEQKAPPIIIASAVSFVDPLPHALILTAIVINFGFTSYLLVLLYRLHVDGDVSTFRELFIDEKRKPLDDGESAP